MKKILVIVMVIVFALSLSFTAIASVSFDAGTGTGFVGKGNVQTAFGWNNATLQKNAKDVTFTYEANYTYKVTEYWETMTGEKEPKIIEHEVIVKNHVSVIGSIMYDTRMKNQITGFILNGFGDDISYDGTVPVVGEDLSGNRQVYDEETQTWYNATVTAVELINSAGDGLNVNYKDISIAMPNTPVIVPVQ